MTEYSITPWVNGRLPAVPAAEDEVREAIALRKVLVAALAIEERYHLLIHNYAEYEKELLQLSVDSNLFESPETELVFEPLHLANRRVANLLTAAKMYLDQVPQLLREVTGQEGSLDVARKEASRQYDLAFGYRLMEALRNHAQHRGLPVHQISPGWSRMPDGSIAHFVALAFEVAQLSEDPQFKKTTLSELEALEQATVDINLYIREYLTGLRSIHAWVRGQMVECVGKADEFFLGAYQRYTESAGDASAAGLAYVSSNPNGTRNLEAWISPLPIRRRRWLERENRSLHSLDAHYVTGEARSSVKNRQRQIYRE
jgi:hypothetical protein